MRTLAGNYQILLAYSALLGPRNRMWFHFLQVRTVDAFLCPLAGRRRPSRLLWPRLAGPVHSTTVASETAVVSADVRRANGGGLFCPSARLWKQPGQDRR